MSKEDFNALVELAMRTEGLSAMRPVVEKELLHYDIFHALDSEGLLKDIVFQGGTALRLCRGSARFSEDLDFAGGREFNSAKLSKIKACIEEHIGRRYGLKVEVKEPKPSGAAENVKVDKWVVSVVTSPGNPSLPRQKIKLEIANIPAYTRELVPLRKNYDFLSGTGTVMVPTEKVSEILADKVVAFPNSLFDKEGKPVDASSRKIRHRDIWDISWLMQNRAALDPKMVANKLADYGVVDFMNRVKHAIVTIPQIVKGDDFNAQMSRFLDSKTFGKTIGESDYLTYLASAAGDVFKNLERDLTVVPTAHVSPKQTSPAKRRAAPVPGQSR